MKFVLDSSVAYKWAVPETDSDKANQLREDFRNFVHDLLVPDIFPGEIGHALTRAERRGLIPIGQSLFLLTDVLQTCPVLQASHPLLFRACEISSQMRTGFFDCLYVALAERERCEFVTADARVLQNLQGRFSFIIPLSALP